MEIRSASFIELAEWCQKLKLSSKGSRAELEDRLFKFYGVEPPKKEAEQGTIIKIESASNTEYFSLDRYGEDYVRLDGGVLITMEDKKKGHSYVIKADSILYNQTLKLLNANGNVEYRITGEGRDETFSGESVTIDLDTWEGFFLKGASKKDRQIESEKLTFTIQGDFISRSSKDFVIIENGNITSSPNIPANYHISAKKIWIFGPGEWGLQNATLYVGHIPLFYFPFFFYPGDEAVFHPVFGYKTREGTFMQTSTYLVGNRKNNKDAAFSFLQLTENEANDKVKERHGIFLRDTDRKLEHPDWYVKILCDIYSRLGAFAGIQGELPQYAPGIKTFTFRGGLGLSRNLYSNSVPGFLDSYTPYWKDENGDLTTHWNRTYFLGSRLPFRYLFETNLAYTVGTLNLGLLFESYSDPYLDQDFFNRKEEMDWANLLEGNFEEATTASLKDSLTWKIDASYTPKIDGLSPYVTSLTFSRFLLSLAWKSKDVESSLLADYDRNVSPTRRFYYPYSLQAPELTVQMSGTILTSEAWKDKTKTGDSKKAQPAPVKDLKPPWEFSEPPKEEKQEDAYKVPDLRKDVTVSAFPLPLAYSVKYTVSPKVNYLLTANPDEWKEPSDAKYDFAYSTVTLQNSVQISYDTQVYDQIFKTAGNLALTMQYQDMNFLNDSLSEAVKNSLRQTAYRNSSSTLANTVEFSTFPLYKNEVFKSSNMKYSNSSILFKKTFLEMDGDSPVYKDRYFRISRDMMTANKVSVDLKAEIPLFTPSASAYYVCPPLDEVFNLTGSLATGPLTSSVTFQTKKDANDVWKNQPISFSETLKISDNVSFATTYKYDFEEDTPSSLDSTLKLWHLTANFSAQYTYPYTFDDQKGWLRDTEKDFIPSSAGLSYNYTYKSDPMWKNRIRLTSGVTSSWTMNLIQFTESSMSFKFDFVFTLYRFLDLKFSSTSTNTMTYQYIPPLAEKVGRSWRNPLTDLAKSFNFWSDSDRHDSFFKLSTLSVEIVHHLDDWDLSMSYSGTPELVTNTNGTQSFRWDSILAITLRWKPISQIKTEIQYDKNGLRY